MQILETKPTSKTFNLYSQCSIWEQLTFDENARFWPIQAVWIRLNPTVAEWNVKRNRITGRQETNNDGSWFHKIPDNLLIFTFTIFGLCRNKPFWLM